VTTRTFGFAPFVALLVASGCGGSSGGGPMSGCDGGYASEAGDAAAPTDGTTPADDNTAPVVVDSGPAGNSYNVPFVTVTLCVPGTSTCQTIDHIILDTGSSGMRIIASVLTSSLVFPEKMATTGKPLVECNQFADGYTWGSVRFADVKIAGEVASNIPIQVIGDPAFATVPSDCQASGMAEDTVAVFGGNGLLGINQIVPDCGPYCASGPQSAAYYSCNGAACTGVTVADADQISNPIASFAQDNNGAVIQMAAVPPGGAPTVAGSVTFGIGTAPNNGLGSAKVLTLDAGGSFSTLYKGSNYSTSFIDSGTSLLAFDDSAITQCTTGGFYCPASTLNLTAQNVGRNNVNSTVTFAIANAATLFNNNPTSIAFDNLGGTGIGGPSFDWGLPFFFGKTLYFAIQNAATPGGKGPYVAY
jgi:hypothetical protein